MKVSLDFGESAQFVTRSEIAGLPIRMQAAWAAYCVSTLGPLLPTTYHDRFPFASCVQTAWDFALGLPINLVAIKELDDKLTYESQVLGQTEKPPASDNPGYWLLGEGYRLAHALAPMYLLPLILRPKESADFAESAVECAGLVYKQYHYWRQGFNDAAPLIFPSYHVCVTNQYYGMTRTAFDVARAHTNEPTYTMFDGIEFPHECELLASELVTASVAATGPTPPSQSQWLREVGQWKGPD